ncbi:MAG: CpaD family pilus assembly protein [Methylocystis sp.]
MSEHTLAPSRGVSFDAKKNRRRIARIAARTVAFLALLPLGACGYNKIAQAPEVAYDYRDRHPVVLAEAEHTIDVFPPPQGRRLDTETYSRIRDFVARYRTLGRGKITVLAPVGADNGSGRTGLDEIRHALASAGAEHSIFLGTYPVADPSLAAPVRLSFVGMKAKVKGACGEWPDDLASGSSLDGWQNKTYWNFGCANQTTLAAQIADPRDLATPRGETPADIETRMRAINNVRKGSDPSVTWATKSTSISGVGGN